MLHFRNHHDVQFMRRHIIYPAQNSFTHALLGNPLCHWDEAWQIRHIIHRIQSMNQIITKLT